MQVELNEEAARRRQRTRAVQLRLLKAAPRAVEQSPSKTYRTFKLGSISKAGGKWDVDWERAHADARKILDAIDFSKRDIVIWVPGTSNHGPHKAFEAAVRESYAGTGSNLVALEYEASWNLRRSLPTGIATLRLVLEGIRERAGDHRVLLSGESQGAWIIGEVIADPAVSKVVDRAVLMGHPWLAQHQYNRGEDSRVRVINHTGDLVTLPVKGDPTVGLDAMLAIRTLDLSKAGSLLKGLAANPKQGVALLKSIIYAVPGLKSFIRNPHDYSNDMTRAVEFLRHATLPASDDYAKLMGLPRLQALAPDLNDPSHTEQAHLRLQRVAAITAYSSLRSAA